MLNSIVLRDIGKFALVTVVPTVIAVLILPEELMTIPFVYVALITALFIKHIYENTLYECPNCKHVFKPKLSDFILSQHQTYYRLLTCPNCKTVAWCPVKYYKGRELDVKLRPISERFTVNIHALLAFTTVVYVLSLIPQVLNLNFVLLAVNTFLYLLYLTFVVYAIVKGYKSQIYLALTFFIVISLILFTFLGFVAD